MAGLTEPPRREIREPRDAELAARDWMRWIGYPDAELTQGGADGGVDVQATGAVAQVKAEATPVGRPAIQQLYGVAQVEGVTALFFAWGGYSDGAVKWAKRASVALFTLNMIGEVQTVNIAAANIIEDSEAKSEEGKARREEEKARKEEERVERMKVERKSQAKKLGMIPFWDEDRLVIGRAEIWKWIETTRLKPQGRQRSLTAVHRDVDPPNGIPLQHCWMRFVVERGADPAVRFTSWGFDSSDIQVAYESLRVPPNGFPLGDPGNAFVALEAPWSHHYSTRWSENLHILMWMIVEISAQAGRPINKRSRWRLHKRA